MRELINGATAIVRGALAAGCNFFAGYPITPATPILVSMMRELPRVGGTAIQAEDEIASIGMCIGAAAGGKLPMTATSGPGISLYSENIGLAMMTELPVVIVDVQRLGPSTGGATTVGQGDVQFARWGTGGGYPVIALAPSNTLECMTLTYEAFQMACQFRCPVILLTDKELNLTLASVDVPDMRDGCQRCDDTTSTRFVDGETVHVTGSTHDEHGAITKDSAKVGVLNLHLYDKIMSRRDELERLEVDLQEDADTLLLSFGISAGAVRAALPLARAAGKRVSSVIVKSLWPVPETGLCKAAQDVHHIVVAELNPGLYVREIQRIFPGREIVSLTRIDGKLITPEMCVNSCI